MSVNDTDLYYLTLAEHIAIKSKCIRAKYGTIIVSSDGRVVSTGFNGKPRGSINDSICYREGLPDNASKPNCCLHSEANAIMFASPEELENGTIYVSGIPCTDCVLMIAQMKLFRCVYLDLPNSTGHMGNLDRTFLKKYGIITIFEGYTP